MRDLRGESRMLWLGALLIAFAMLWLARMASGAQTIAVQVSPDGLWRVELSSVTTTTPKFELWSTPTVGGVRRKIGHAVQHDYDVFEFLISGDSARVVYRQGRTATGESKLYSTPIDAARGAQISQPLPALGRVAAFIESWRGGASVRYRWSPEPGPLGALYVVPMRGGEILPSAIFADGFEGGNTSRWAR